MKKKNETIEVIIRSRIIFPYCVSNSVYLHVHVHVYTTILNAFLSSHLQADSVKYFLDEIDRVGRKVS